MQTRTKGVRLAIATTLAVAAGLAGATPARAQDPVSINQQVDEALDAAQLDRAAQLARQGLDASRARGDTPWVAAFSTKLGMALYLQGKNRQAEPVLAEAVALFERIGGPADDRLPGLLLFLGASIDKQGRYPEAERTYRRALDLARRQQPPDPGKVANLLRTIAGTLEKQGQFARAEEALRQGLQIHERQFGPNHVEVAAYLDELALLVKALDRLAEAEALFKRALAIAEVSPEASRSQYGMVPTLAVVLSNLSVLYSDTGRNDEAEPLLKRSLALLLGTVGPDHLAVASIHANLGRIARDAGRLAEAEREFRAELAIREKAQGVDHPDLDHALQCLALVDIDQNRPAEAESHLRRALALKEKAQGADHPDSAKLAAQLARACREQGKDDEAERLYQRALTAQEKALGSEHSAVGETLYFLAVYRRGQGKSEEAERLFRRSLAIVEKTGGPDSQLANYVRSMLARACADQGRWDEARALLDRVIAGYERAGESPANRAMALQARAFVLAHQGETDRAIEDARLAIDLAEQQRVQYAGAERERAEAFAGLGSTFELMIDLQAARGADKADAGAIFDAMERAHARTLLDEMELAGTDLDAGRPPAERARLKAREAELKTKIRELELKLTHLKGPDDPTSGPLAAELAGARNGLYEFYRDERSTNPTYRALLSRGSKLPTLAEIQKGLLRPGDLMLAYFFGEQMGAYLEVTPESARLWRVGFDAREAKVLGVDEGPLTADRLRRALLNREGTGLVQRLSDPRAEVPAEGLAVLTDTLIPPDRKKELADGTIKRLIIVPDGPLALLPFEALVMERREAPAYLLDVGPAVDYAPSAAVLKSLAERPSAPAAAGREPVLALGDPAYPASGTGPAVASRGPLTSRSRWALAGGKLPRLPYSGWEAQWVAKAFSAQAIPAVTLTAATATEAGVRYWSRGRRILHLACHGLADPELGNFFGALALAPGPRPDNPADDGFLNLNEIHALDLKGCELAVLSACESNLDPGHRGDGTFALSRGFLVAGARRVVASDWLVDDEAAASLVSVYCTLLAKAEKAGGTVDYATALRDAKRWVRRQDKWKAPYYWASLVLVGPH